MHVTEKKGECVRKQMMVRGEGRYDKAGLPEGPSEQPCSRSKRYSLISPPADALPPNHLPLEKSNKCNIMWLCTILCKCFENTFENTQWGKVQTLFINPADTLPPSCPLLLFMISDPAKICNFSAVATNKKCLWDICSQSKAIFESDGIFGRIDLSRP